MRWSDEHLYERILAKDASFDGRVLTGVLTTGIYCLPSCPARKPLARNVRFFADEGTAQAAGLRPCKRCRPDAFYRGEDADLARLEDAMAQALADPAAFPEAEALAEAAGVGLTKLKTLLRDHAHTQPAAFLQRARIQAACARLETGEGSLLDLGGAVGFESPSGFHEAFRRQTGLAPGAYRDLLGSSRFTLPLPEGTRLDDLLRFHGRDPESVSERVVGPILRKGAHFAGKPGVLSLAFGTDTVAVTLEGAQGPAAMAEAHRAALRLLAWHGDPASFETAHPALARGREGLRVPLTLDPFEALVWAILGQQVNLAFAYALRRDLICLAGTPVGELIAHPEAARLAALEPGELVARRFSRRKAEYVLNAAGKVAAGELRLEEMLTATGAGKALLALRGCGPWTAQYVLMRGLGFRDCVPVGDAALTLALQRWFKLEARPDGPGTTRLMAPFAPHRSLATFHLWASLKGVPA
ncbi:DNA-3-methyladenine glycosylase 2 [Geothrix edaphica]|uniref:DNA-3-methyladenine glycosylase II n=1 Tax=Geothrix edaphica TaxID=2927976 RepID=A0ABQ5PX95_9BACT|nr:Ada metal-binding domain-containing protein [Geothrix edaphica]GLH66976.1 AraC family transcriptional regulator [Geothrix edaphica]